MAFVLPPVVPPLASAFVSSSRLFLLRGGRQHAQQNHQQSYIQYSTSTSSTLSNSTIFTLSNKTETDPSKERQPPPPRRRRITYLTDVEGDQDYLTRYVENSQLLCFRPTTHQDKSENLGNYCLDFPYDHCIDFSASTCSTEEDHDNDIESYDSCLVYGGDVCDQGGSDLYVIRQLLHLKARYPESVHMVMGNRDINKLRLVRELETTVQDGAKEHLAPPSNGVFWLRGTGMVGDPELNEPLTRSPVERLQWILRRTMGSPNAFRYRKEELEREQQQKLQKEDLTDEQRPITDDDVVKSYQETTRPDGEMGQYLANAKLAVRLGEALFVHGALPLTDENLQQGYRPDFWDDLTFAMPWLPPNTTARDVGVETIEDWLNALNDFAARNIKAFQEHPYEGEMHCVRGGYDTTANMQPYGQLIQYGTYRSPDIGRNPTIVYNSWCHNGMPRKFFPDADNTTFARVTRDFFQRSGVALICSGHQPQGDMPNSIRIPLKNGTCWILSCDTSYSGDTVFLNLPEDSLKRINPGREGSLSGRGARAVSEVLIEQCTKTGKILDVYCHGVLADGSKYRTASLDFSSPVSAQENSHSLVVGEIAAGPMVPAPEDSPHKGKWWTRAEFVDRVSKSDSRSYMLASGEGYDFWNRVVDKR